jgi:chemotaxis protein methyltransferase CheR
MAIDVQIASSSTGESVNAHDPLYLRIRDLVYQACGIYHPEEKIYLLAGACKRRLNGSKASSPKDYFDLLSSPATRDSELRALLNEITIGETCLFRSQPQLNALHNVILPELVTARAKLGLRRMRIWSAGCSTGEESYTLAMFLSEESEHLLKGWSFEIAGVDINEEAANLIRFQNAYQASAQISSVINSLMQTTISMVQ